MKDSYYTYIGPVIKLNKKLNNTISYKGCSNGYCSNNKKDNKINIGDSFCFKCGNPVKNINIEEKIEPYLYRMMENESDEYDFFGMFFQPSSNEAKFLIPIFMKEYENINVQVPGNFSLKIENIEVLYKVFINDKRVKKFLEILDKKYGKDFYTVEVSIVNYLS